MMITSTRVCVDTCSCGCKPDEAGQFARPNYDGAEGYCVTGIVHFARKLECRALSGWASERALQA